MARGIAGRLPGICREMRPVRPLLYVPTMRTRRSTSLLLATSFCATAALLGGCSPAAAPDDPPGTGADSGHGVVKDPGEDGPDAMTGELADTAPPFTLADASDGAPDSTAPTPTADSSTVTPDAEPDSGPPGTVIFTGDFETGDLSQWATVQEGCDDAGNDPRIVVYSAEDAPAGAPMPRQGKYAAKFHVLNGDTDAHCTTTDNPRAQLMTNGNLEKPGNDLWQFWSAYFPPDFPSCGALSDCWLLFQEDYEAPYTVGPALGWTVETVNGVDSMTLSHVGSHKWSAPLILGAWVDFLVHKNFENTAGGGGFVEAWVNGTQIAFNDCSDCTRLPFQTMNTGQTEAGFFLASYRAKNNFPSVDTYYDAVRVGTTRAAVELP